MLLPPVGTGSATGLRETTLALPGRAQVCFFTDGVIEARVEGDLFGVERLTLALEELGHGATAQGVLDEVVARSDRRPDDMAACLLSVPGGEYAPSLRSEEIELRGEHTDWQGPRQLLAACGVDALAIHTAIGRARETVARTGGAILRVRFDGPFPAASVAPADANLAWGHGPPAASTRSRPARPHIRRVAGSGARSRASVYAAPAPTEPPARGAVRALAAGASTPPVFGWLRGGGGFFGGAVCGGELR